jgi:MFS family permease
MSTRDTSRRSHRAGWRGFGYPLLLVNAALVLVTVSEGVLLSIVPSTAVGIGQLLHISPGSLNWINTVQLLSTGVCTPVFSRLDDFRGQRQVMRAPALLTAAGGLLMAVAPDFSLLLAGRALQGPGGRQPATSAARAPLVSVPTSSSVDTGCLLRHSVASDLAGRGVRDVGGR